MMSKLAKTVLNLRAKALVVLMLVVLVMSNFSLINAHHNRGITSLDSSHLIDSTIDHKPETNSSVPGPLPRIRIRILDTTEMPHNEAEADDDRQSQESDRSNYVATTPRGLPKSSTDSDPFDDDSAEEEVVQDDNGTSNDEAVHLEKVANKSPGYKNGNADSSTSSSSSWSDTIQLIGTVLSLARSLKSAAAATITTTPQPGITRSADDEDKYGSTPLIGSTRVDSDDGSGSQSAEQNTTFGQVAEGRYIKGDPLKGYYDFVITEGSYKFWAVFQLATAALIIYSTFAAIYYSKVNPLTSDYDYVDYFGGRSLGSGRSLDSAGGDEDNVDIDTEEEASKNQDESSPRSDSSSLFSGWSSVFDTSSSKFQWLSTAAHSFDFVLNAIDKVPL